MKQLLLLVTLLAAACATDAQAPEQTAGAAGSAPIVNVRADQFDVGVDKEALTRTFNCINSDGGSQIWWDTNGGSGLRCWLMQFGQNGLCNPNQFSCWYFPSSNQMSCTQAGGGGYLTQGCNSTGCTVRKVTASGTASTVGSFKWYSSAQSGILASGTAPGYSHLTCRPQGNPTLTLWN